jgi:hypothetical protein
MGDSDAFNVAIETQNPIIASERSSKSWSRWRAVMLRAVPALMLALFVTGAHARASSPIPKVWSSISPQHLQRIPVVARVALQQAQRLCGEDNIWVRSGFLRYLHSPAGEDFVVVHFDEFRCNDAHALCSSEGCLHRVFFAKNGGQYREVWRGNAHEINMNVGAGQPSMDVYCGHKGTFCDHQLRWNGSQFR